MSTQKKYNPYRTGRDFSRPVPRRDSTSPFDRPTRSPAAAVAENIGKRAAARLAAKLGMKFVPYLNAASTAYDLYDWWQQYQRTQNAGVRINGFRQCFAAPPCPNKDWPSYYAGTFGSPTCGSPGNCNSLNFRPLYKAIQPGWNSISRVISQTYTADGASASGVGLQQWVRVDALAQAKGVNVWPADLPVKFPEYVNPRPNRPAPNPNVARAVPAAAKPQGEPDPRSDHGDSSSRVPRAVSRHTFDNDGSVRRYDKPVRTRPPARREKERKFTDRIGRLTAALVNALDKVSEGGEVIDALYNALPEKVRAVYDKAHKDDVYMGPGGQYNVDGVNWKAEALYNHWDELDVQQAVENIIANEIEDALYGAAFAAKKNVSYGAFR